MAEIELTMGEFFRFAQNKHEDLCSVKGCRNKRKPDRRLCCRCHMKLWRARNPMRAAYHALKHGAKSRKIKFTITFDDFKEICTNTGYLAGRGQSPSDLHMDRINPNRGYEVDNLQVLTCSENSRKGATERWVTLKSGKKIRLCDIHLGVPAVVDEIPEEDEDDDLPMWMKEPTSKPRVLTDSEPF